MKINRWHELLNITKEPGGITYHPDWKRLMKIYHNRQLIVNTKRRKND